MSEQKQVVITGTSRGIGFELVRLFADAGHSVLALSRTQQSVVALQRENVTCLPIDLSQPADFDRISDFLSAAWKRVDILINNAGKLLNKPFTETTYQEFEEIYRVNTLGVAELIKRTLPFMPPDGHVVTISSMGGVQGSAKFPGLSAYSSSKGAVIILTELLAETYKTTGPAFNALALGAVQTEMLQEAFPGYQAPVTAAEMAAYIFRFALEGHRYYNGKTLPVSKTTP